MLFFIPHSSSFIPNLSLILANTTANQILQNGIDAQQQIAAAMDNLWTDVLGGGLYVAITRLGVLFAVGTLLIFLVQWTKGVLNDEDVNPLSELIWPLLVVTLLANNGALLSTCTLAVRNIINQTNEILLTTTSSTISLQVAYQQIMGEIGAEAAIQSIISQCSAIADPQQQSDCLAQAAAQADLIASSLPAPPSNALTNLINGVKSWVTNPGEQVVQAISSTLQLAVRGWLVAFGIAFQWIVEVSLLLTALLGPLSVGGTLLPVGQKAIFAWLTGFFSVGLIKICFNIITGLVATMVVNAGTNDPMIFAFATGLLAPILALILASGGGIAIFNSLSSISSKLLIYAKR
jgi:hypothetical protein